MTSLLYFWGYFLGQSKIADRQTEIKTQRSCSYCKIMTYPFTYKVQKRSEPLVNTQFFVKLFFKYQLIELYYISCPHDDQQISGSQLTLQV